MGTLRTILFLLMVIILPCNLWAQQYLLSHFVETTLPARSDTNWRQFLGNTYGFKVSVKGGKLKIGYYDTNDYDEEVSLVVDNGRIVGTDEGEFIGRLNFVDGAGDTTFIKRGNFRFIFNYNHEVYFIDNYDTIKYDAAHYQTIDQGALFKLVWRNGAYTYRRILRFDETALSMCFMNDDIIVASWNYCYQIHNLRKEIILKVASIFDDSINTSFELNSVAYADGKQIYLGTDGGYLRLEIANSTIKYYKYRE